ncbi:hypothetical protein C0992_007831 [Termitomyces sp. T32_za158]|nr:hypothetical protein C0992_007831 [Termitomyces sp. T32_za158]
MAKAENNLFNLKMRPKEQFTTFIIRFEKEAYETSWNYSTLRYALRHTLPQHIKDVLWLAPKQPLYNSYKVLVMQVDQRYWEDRSKYNNAQTQWNSGQSWQAGATSSPNILALLILPCLLPLARNPPSSETQAPITQHRDLDHRLS